MVQIFLYVNHKKIKYVNYNITTFSENFFENFILGGKLTMKNISKLFNIQHIDPFTF